MTVKEALIAARALIAKKSRWIQGSMARKKDGTSVTSDDSQAYKFCAVGALSNVVSKKTRIYDISSQKLARFMKPFITGFNDTHTHKEVLAAFDKAIKGCRK